MSVRAGGIRITGLIAAALVQTLVPSAVGAAYPPPPRFTGLRVINETGYQVAGIVANVYIPKPVGPAMNQTMTNAYQFALPIPALAPGDSILVMPQCAQGNNGECWRVAKIDLNEFVIMSGGNGSTYDHRIAVSAPSSNYDGVGGVEFAGFSGEAVTDVTLTFGQNRAVLSAKWAWNPPLQGPVTDETTYVTREAPPPNPYPCHCK